MWNRHIIIHRDTCTVWNFNLLFFLHLQKFWRACGRDYRLHPHLHLGQEAGNVSILLIPPVLPLMLWTCLRSGPVLFSWIGILSVKSNPPWAVRLCSIKNSSLILKNKYGNLIQLLCKPMTVGSGQQQKNKYTLECRMIRTAGLMLKNYIETWQSIVQTGQVGQVQRGVWRPRHDTHSRQSWALQGRPRHLNSDFLSLFSFVFVSSSNFLFVRIFCCAHEKKKVV